MKNSQGVKIIITKCDVICLKRRGEWKRGQYTYPFIESTGIKTER